MSLPFIRVKMQAACRTIDLCRVKSADLTGEVLHMTADATKTRTDRAVPLPPDLAARRHQIKGRVWLWEKSVAESKTHRPDTRTKSQTEYRPEAWRWTVQNLVREFNESRPAAKRVRLHDLRARGITLIAAATGSVDAVPEAAGCDPQTARHYLDWAGAFDRMELFKKLTGVLLPPSNPSPVA